VARRSFPDIRGLALRRPHSQRRGLPSERSGTPRRCRSVDTVGLRARSRLIPRESNRAGLNRRSSTAAESREGMSRHTPPRYGRRSITDRLLQTVNSRASRWRVASKVIASLAAGALASDGYAPSDRASSPTGAEADAAGSAGPVSTSNRRDRSAEFGVDKRPHQTWIARKNSSMFGNV